MFMTATNLLLISIFTLVAIQNSHSKEPKSYCYEYSNKENTLPEIKNLKLSWSDSDSSSSLLIVESQNNQVFVSELICSEFPKLGKCGLFDDGGEFEIFKINSNRTKILLKILGQIKPENVMPEDYQYLSIRRNINSKPRLVILEIAEDKKCNIDEEY